MELTIQEKNSSTWRKIDRYLEELIARAREKNEGPLDLDKTNELRGRIRAFKALKSLGDEEPFVEGQPLPE